MEYLHSQVYQLVILFQACKVAAVELFLADRVNELYKNLNERIRGGEP